MIWNDKTVLVLAPHTDDAEIGCGGTIAKLIDNGNEVHQVAFSSAYKIKDDGMVRTDLAKEIINASKILGISSDNIQIHEFPTRSFHTRRQDILDLMLYYKEKLKPDIIFAPSVNDIHQDHSVIIQEAKRAFKFDTLLSYEMAHNQFNSDLQLFVSLSMEQIGRKAHACSKFLSQANRQYFDSSYLKALAMTRGLQSNNQFAEVFEVVRINM